MKTTTRSGRREAGTAHRLVVEELQGLASAQFGGSWTLTRVAAAGSNVLEWSARAAGQALRHLGGLGSGPCAQALARRRVVIAADLGSGDIDGAPRAAWVAPCIFRDRVIGCFVGYFPEPRTASPAERDALVHLARLGASVLEAGLRQSDLARRAFHDSLTGLANRALFDDRLQTALAQAERSRAPLAVLFLDLDGFKPVNDRLGHAAGDALLRAVAQRLRGAFRSCDTLARLGGDEFAAVLNGLRSPADVAPVQARVEAALAGPFVWRGRPLLVGASIGVALYPEDARLARGLIECADARMYEAKARRAAVTRGRLGLLLGRGAQ
ncbi:MAG: GGDEF domain-containing protein [Vicinamibacteria bacterium]|nr:GGDEF domain-containing protein [Vicinamibacteria bacterium]